MNLKKFSFYKNKVAVNLLARDLENAKEVQEVLDGHVVIGILSKNFKTVEEGVGYVKTYQKDINTISIGLGDGDPNQWKMAAEIAAETDPGHVNQVFPTAAFTLGLLEGKGCKSTVVNALIRPTGEPGKVIISTGSSSSQMEEAVVSSKVALGMLKDAGLMSVKFFNIGGLKYIDDLKNIAKTAVQVGIPIIEPTGGISLVNIKSIVKVCLDAGIEIVIPHVYSSAIDEKTGLTNPIIVKKIYDEIQSLFK
ncbi:oxo-acid lyase [Alkalibaculum sp. M08DMB]|uniref:Oxo-acid lyase n=1 Tax=Alkalibaculum sporogenes TaxID=2655001 RepID=A0A6A7K874_9FIRM|nr:KDGP aldolase [Alkalibaculum sporogenes]MPW25585.1 oxo-acid lyase [Alkalibaculum sporogenes]